MSNQFFAKKISQRQNEEIIMILRHHPITYWRQILIAAVLILVAFFLMFLLFSWGPIGVALFLAILGTGFFYGAREFFIWYMNAFVITNVRIVDIDQTGFFSQIVSELDYNKILDICYSINGIVQAFLKLGTIRINAAGTKLVITNLPNVAKVNQILTDLIREQTGKSIEAKQVKQLSVEEKSVVQNKLTEDFLHQDTLDAYAQYDLDELIAEYQETFSELRLKKMLVDELETHDKAATEQKEINQEEQDEVEESLVEEKPEESVDSDDEDEPGLAKPKFRKKRL